MMTGIPTDELSAMIKLRHELIADGLTDKRIRAMTRGGELHRIRHGSYISGALWDQMSVEQRHRVLVRAVMRRAHPCAVATHISSAIERGAPVWGISLDEAHLTRLDGGTGRRETGIVHHRGVLTPAAVEVVNGLPVSSAARAAVEVTMLASVEPSLVTVNGLLHSGQLTAEAFATEIERCKFWPDTLTASVVQRLVDPRIGSVAESRFSFLCWDQRLPRPEAQVPILDEFGHEFAYADFAWEREGVFLEFDGRIKYERFRREGESLPDYLMREKKREERICMLTGWVCIRIGWADLENPRRTAERIRRLLVSRRMRVAPR